MSDDLPRPAGAYPNFERPSGGEPPDGLTAFVRQHGFEYTLLELAEMFDTDKETVREALRDSGEYLTAIPMQDGERHVWGYSDEAHQEWEYLRRRCGGLVSILLALNFRAARVMTKYGPPLKRADTDMVQLLLELRMAMPEPTPDGNDS